MQFDPKSPMGRLQTKPKVVRDRAARMWRWKNRELVERLLREIAQETSTRPPQRPQVL
jgi:hypothetical protein